MSKAEHQMIGIYKITNPKKQVYIGQSINIKKRLNNYKNLSCVGQPKLYKSLMKYGVEAHVFETVTECEIDDLNKLERYYQDLYHACDKNGLNCKLTGYLGSNKKYKGATVTPGLRIDYELWQQVSEKYPRQINKMFIEWIKTL